MKRIAVIIILSSFSVFASARNPELLDSLFRVLERSDKTMGSVSIYEEDREVYTNTIGYVELESQQKANELSKYRVGSISKMYTAIIIVQLVEEGKLSFETKLATFYPQLNHARKVTIAQMLRHRSGIYNVTEAADYMNWMTRPISREEMLKRIKKNGNSEKPGKQRSYSNSNYILLSYIAEDLSGKTLKELVAERICKPCMLESTYMGSEIQKEQNEALSYMNPGKWVLAPQTDLSVPQGAGAMVANPSDLNKFIQCLFRKHLVEEKSLETMKTLIDGFGMGMFRFEIDDREALGHTGGIDAFTSALCYFTEEKVSIAFCSNGKAVPMDEIFSLICEIYFGREPEIPNYENLFTPKAEDLSLYPGVYSGKPFPLKLRITVVESSVIGQATGQPAFTLEPIEQHFFGLKQAGLVIEFRPGENKLILTQNGKTFVLMKE